MKTLQIFLRKSKTTAFLSALIILSSFLFSIAVEASPSEYGSGYDFTIYVDQENCNACGACETVAPDCFVVVDDVAWVMVGWEYYPDQFIDAIEVCPNAAIHVR